MRTVAHISKPEQARHAAKRTSPARQKKPAHFRGAEEDLGAPSRALYGFGEPTENELLLAETALESVEDPLDDWPESGTDADDWLRSHGVRSDEEGDA